MASELLTDLDFTADIGKPWYGKEFRCICLECNVLN